MGDVFLEQLVKRKPTGRDTLIRTGLILGVAIIFLVTMTIIPGLGMIITLAFGFGAYILNGRLKKEYEYSFTNGELDIDVIYNRSSRKRIFNGHVRDFELMAHVDDQNHKNSLNTASERLDYSTGIPSGRSYNFLTNYKGKRVAIIIEPNEEMLAAIGKAMTRSKFYPKK